MSPAWIVLCALIAGAEAAPAGPAPAPPAPPAAAAQAGAAQAGRELFAGGRIFRNGGAPCGACHALGGQGMALTASFGPELSGSLAGMDPGALEGLLADLPFPSMAPVYLGHPLTAEERADLVAFLIPAASLGPPAADWRFESLGLLGAVLGFLVLAVAWRRRKTPSRARLLARAHLQQGGSR